MMISAGFALGTSNHLNSIKNTDALTSMAISYTMKKP